MLHRRSLATLVLAAMVLSACGGKATVEDAGDAPAAAPALAGLDYPPARRVDQVDDYHGVRVADPYRWMEDLDAAELAQWIAAENRLTQAWLADAPGRAAIKARLTALYDYERFGIPEAHGGRTFYLRNDGLQNQSPLYVQEAGAASARLLLDPNALSADGTELFIAALGAGTVAVLDTATNTITGTIAVGGSPFGLAVTQTAV